MIEKTESTVDTLARIGAETTAREGVDFDSLRTMLLAFENVLPDLGREDRKKAARGYWSINSALLQARGGNLDDAKRQAAIFGREVGLDYEYVHAVEETTQRAITSLVNVQPWETRRIELSAELTDPNCTEGIAPRIDRVAVWFLDLFRRLKIRT